ncbi:MAG: hypothetical protein GY937_01430 [bacterium]|nr:hypothetical protein [bacterium]
MSGTESEPSILGVAIRDLTRLQAVCVAVARHGFGEILMRTSLGPRVFDAAAPKAVDVVLNTVYELFLDSAAAKGEGAGRKPEMSSEAVLFAHLAPGVHR